MDETGKVLDTTVVYPTFGEKQKQDAIATLSQLVKKDNGIGLPANLLGELSRLVVAEVVGRRADDSGNGELLHELGHIEPY